MEYNSRFLHNFLSYSGTYPYDENMNYSFLRLSLTLLHLLIDNALVCILFCVSSTKPNEFSSIEYNIESILEILISNFSSSQNIIYFIFYIIKRKELSKITDMITILMRDDISSIKLWYFYYYIFVLFSFFTLLIDVVEIISYTGSILQYYISTGLYLSKALFSVSFIGQVTNFLSVINTCKGLQNKSSKVIIRKWDLILGSCEYISEVFTFHIFIALSWNVLMTMYILFVASLFSNQFIGSVIVWILNTSYLSIYIVHMFNIVRNKVS